MQNAFNAKTQRRKGAKAQGQEEMPASWPTLLIWRLELARATPSLQCYSEELLIFGKIFRTVFPNDK
jgi:hypothetical protein